MLHTNKLSLALLQSSNERSGSSEHLSNAETWSSHERILCKSNLPTSTLELEQSTWDTSHATISSQNPNFSQQLFNLQITTPDFFLATHTFDPSRISLVFTQWLNLQVFARKFSHPNHIVWKLLKMSNLNFWILAFSTNFFLSKTDLSGNTVWPQASGVQKLAKMDHFCHF